MFQCPDTCHSLHSAIAQSCRHCALKYWCQCVNIWSINTCAITNYTSTAAQVCVCGRINKSYGNGSALQAPESGGKWKREGVKGAWSGRKAARPKAIYMQFSHIFFPYSRFFLLHRKPARSKRLPLKDNITFCPPFVFYISLHLATINGFLTKTWKYSKICGPKSTSTWRITNVDRSLKYIVYYIYFI